MATDNEHISIADIDDYEYDNVVEEWERYAGVYTGVLMEIYDLTEMAAAELYASLNDLLSIQEYYELQYHIDQLQNYIPIDKNLLLKRIVEDKEVYIIPPKKLYTAPRAPKNRNCIVTSCVDTRLVWDVDKLKTYNLEMAEKQYVGPKWAIWFSLEDLETYLSKTFAGRAQKAMLLFTAQRVEEYIRPETAACKQRTSYESSMLEDSYRLGALEVTCAKARDKWKAVRFTAFDQKNYSDTATLTASESKRLKQIVLEWWNNLSSSTATGHISKYLMGTRSHPKTAIIGHFEINQEPQPITK